MKAAIPLSPAEREACPFTVQDRIWLASRGIFSRYLAHEIGPPRPALPPEWCDDEEADR